VPRLLSLALIVVAFYCAESFGQAPARIVIHDVTIVDVRSGALQPDMTAVVAGNRIADIHKTIAADRSAPTVVDGRGKFLIPGLWDMEVHLSWTTDSALPLLIAKGVTDVRDMGSDVVQIEHWRARTAEGSLAGPTIVRVGPMLNGKSFNQYQMVVGPPEEARAVVRTLKFIGMDGLSLERRVPRDSYFALMAEAKKADIPVGGHIPIAITPEEASDAGQRTIENADTLFEGMLVQGIPEEKLAAKIHEYIRSGAADALFARFVKNHTAYTPAISQFEWSLRDADPAAPDDPRKRYVAKSLRDFFRKHPLEPSDRVAMTQMFPELLNAVGRMNQDGVTLLAGTDIAGSRIPGFSLHDELAMLVRAGLTPLAALRSATINPAMVLGREHDHGTIEVGKIADLVLLGANPLDDIHNVDRIVAVIANGRLYRAPDIDALLRVAEERAASQ
jgi:cytosine/adenosine deaminase-related metal-dependent hydrolase